MGAPPLPPDVLRESLLRWALVLGTTAIDTIWIGIGDFHFVGRTVLTLVGFNSVLLASAWYFGWRRHDTRSFVLLDTAAQLTSFSCAAATLSYLILSLNLPLVDRQLSALDQALDFDWPRFVVWVQAHPIVDLGLQSVYAIWVLEWLILPPLLAYRQEHLVRELIGIGMIALLLTIVIGGLAPAMSAYAYYSPAYPGLVPEIRMDDLFALRSGQLRTIDLRAMVGLVSFPSFHAIGALLFVYVARSRPVLLPVSALINAAVLVSTLSAGGHYLIDLVGGALVLAISAGIYHALTRHADPASRPERRDLATEGA